jgi:hypothetical protein
MSELSLQKQIDEENQRRSRIAAQLDVMPPHQLKRLEAAQRSLELALARTFGHRLNEEVASRIVAGMVLDPACLCSVGGGVNELPTSPQGWDSYARELANAEPLAKLSINHSDSKLKETIRNEAERRMRPEDRIKMARAGTLDDHLGSIVATEMEALSFQ